MDDNNEYVDIYSHSSMENRNDDDTDNAESSARVSVIGQEDIDISSHSDPSDENNTVRTTFPVGSLSDMNDRRGEAVKRKKAAKEKKKRSRAVTFLVVGIIMLLLCGAVAVAAWITNGFGLIAAEPAEESSAAPEISTQEKSEPSVQPSKVQEESKEEINFKSDAKFTKKTDRFSASVRNSLENEIQSRHVVLYDVTADQIIYEKDASKKCYPASTTKLMTAVVSSKYLKKDDIITVGREVYLIGYDSSVAGLRPGMRLTYEMMLDALLLPSGNDAAYSIAVETAKVYKQDHSLANEECIRIFAELMNNAAKEMGCKGTHFTAPDGFHDDDHYVTAEDMTKIAAYALKTPIVANSCKKHEATWELLPPDKEESSDDDDDASALDTDDNIDENGSRIESEEESEEEEYTPTEVTWYNSNQLLDSEGGQYSKYATGMKTGFTDEAWTCVVSSAKMQDHEFIAVVMKSPSNYQKYHESNLLFKLGFKLYDLKYTSADDWVN